MNKALFCSVAAVGILTLAPAVAQPAPSASQAPAPGQQPGRIGRNMKVQTRADVAAHVRTIFARLDANHDGFLARDEIGSGRMERGQRAGDAGDPAMRTGGQNGMFDRIDTNHDGSISRDEFAHAPKREDRGVAVHNGENEGGMRPMHGMGMAGLHGRMFDMADANHDGRISLQEATDAALRRFDMADLNHDGQLTAQERAQAHQAMKAQRSGA